MAACPFWSEWLEIDSWPHGTEPCAAWFGEKRAPAAGGRRREPAFSAAVGKHEGQRKPEVFSGHRKAARSDEAATWTKKLDDSSIFAVSRKAKMQTSLATPANMAARFFRSGRKTRGKTAVLFP